MAYKFCPTGTPPLHLKFKNRVPGMVIRNLLHATLVNRKLFVMKAHTRRAVQVASVDSNVNETQTYPLHPIKVHFSYHGVKVTRMQYPLCLAFAGTVHKVQ